MSDLDVPGAFDRLGLTRVPDPHYIVEGGRAQRAVRHCRHAAYRAAVLQAPSQKQGLLLGEW